MAINATFPFGRTLAAAQWRFTHGAWPSGIASAVGTCRSRASTPMAIGHGPPCSPPAGPLVVIATVVAIIRTSTSYALVTRSGVAGATTPKVPGRRTKAQARRALGITNVVHVEAVHYPAAHCASTARWDWGYAPRPIGLHVTPDRPGRCPSDGASWLLPRTRMTYALRATAMMAFGFNTSANRRRTRPTRVAWRHRHSGVVEGRGLNHSWSRRPTSVWGWAQRVRQLGDGTKVNRSQRCRSAVESATSIRASQRGLHEQRTSAHGVAAIAASSVWTTPRPSHTRSARLTAS